MKINSKDKSLILFIAASLIVLWFLFSFLAKSFFATAFAISETSKLLSQYDKNQSVWLNTSRSLEKKDLKNRIILLNFFNYSCANCINAINEIKKLEKDLGNKIVVISVHSARSDNEKDIESVKKAVLKYDITHPVINDSELKILKSFGLEGTPSFAVIDPIGRVKSLYSGDKKIYDAIKDMHKMVSKYRYHINREDLPIILEKNKAVQNVLSYPLKTFYVNDFSYNSFKGPVLFIANSGNNNILVSSVSGEIILQIGGKKAGFKDGNFDDAMFNFPSSIIFKNNKLFVADTLNNAIRQVDFKNNKVSTLLENKDSNIFKSEKKKTLEISIPLDIEFYPDFTNIAIANSGSNQILSYNIDNKELKVIAGNGINGSLDGDQKTSELSQPSDLSSYNGKLYFVDSKSNSLRFIDNSGSIKTIKTDDLKNPQGLATSSQGIFIADSFNHKIKKYDYSNSKIKNILGSEKGDEIDDILEFDEPSAISIAGDSLYISDTNNNRIIVANKKLRTSLLNVMPQLELPKDSFLQYLPNLEKFKPLKIKKEKVAIKIGIANGWKINDMGPSFINILEMIEERKAKLITTFDWNMIRNGDLILPKLNKGSNYLIQGTIYYCEDKRNALCFIKSYEQPIIVDEAGEDKIKINIEVD